MAAPVIRRHFQIAPVAPNNQDTRIWFPQQSLQHLNGPVQTTKAQNGYNAEHNPQHQPLSGGQPLPLIAPDSISQTVKH
jgi:hypothetical protein